MPLFTVADLNATVDPAIVLRLLDDDNDGVVDAAPLAKVQDDVLGELRGYIARLYDLSAIEASPSKQVIALACELAIEYAYRRRPELHNDRGETPWNGRYQAALRRLKEIQKGDFRLDVDGVPEDPANVGGSVDFGPDNDHPGGVGGGIFFEGFGDF